MHGLSKALGKERVIEKFTFMTLSGVQPAILAWAPEPVTIEKWLDGSYAYVDAKGCLLKTFETLSEAIDGAGDVIVHAESIARIISTARHDVVRWGIKRDLERLVTIDLD